MKLHTMIFLALGLAMDAFAVSVSDGMYYRKLSVLQTLAIPLFFGIFQGVMPLLGVFAGSVFSESVMKWDHWIAFGLLIIIGGRMMIEAIRELRSPQLCSPVGFSLHLLLFQSVATSVDALAVGVGFALTGTDGKTASLIIATVAFVCSLIGVRLGRRFGKMIGTKAEIAGGALLIVIGLKLLLEHLL